MLVVLSWRSEGVSASGTYSRWGPSFLFLSLLLLLLLPFLFRANLCLRRHHRSGALGHLLLLFHLLFRLLGWPRCLTVPRVPKMWIASGERAHSARPAVLPKWGRRAFPAFVFFLRLFLLREVLLLLLPGPPPPFFLECRSRQTSSSPFARPLGHSSSTAPCTRGRSRRPSSSPPSSAGVRLLSRDLVHRLRSYGQAHPEVGDLAGGLGKSQSPPPGPESLQSFRSLQGSGRPPSISGPLGWNGETSAVSRPVDSCCLLGPLSQVCPKSLFLLLLYLLLLVRL